MSVIQSSLLDRIRAVKEADDAEDFVALIALAGLDPMGGALRYSNWSDISFDGCDLRGFDFTGSRMSGCSFKGAQIEGARFEAADMLGANLRMAKDWREWKISWTPQNKPLTYRHLRTGSVFQDAPFAPVMVVVPAGEFYMGSPDGSGGEQGEVAEVGRTQDEGRRKKIQMSQRFAVGRFAVTVEEFDAFVSATKYVMPYAMETYEYRKLETRPTRDWRSPGFVQSGLHPVVGVRWEDAVAYCEWLSTVTRQEYRLPSEAEWEYVARAGTTSPYWWGDRISPADANYETPPPLLRQESETISVEDYEERLKHFEIVQVTAPVDAYKPNPWGLFQVHGNVWEWCDNSYDAHRTVASSRWSGSKYKAMRGGSWRTSGRDCRSANRSRECKHLNYVGFRVLKTSIE